TMSHELRTPLNSIINFAFLLLQEVEGPITPQQRELLSRIELSGKHLLSLINDILDLAKIESGKMELYLEETDSNIIIKEMIGVTESLIQNKPIKLIYAAEDSLPPVKADRVRLRQILLNILSNAVKFTDEGTITLKIIRQDDFLVFSIIDTGIGISESDVNKAFAEFVQLDTGYARKAGGTGLGLPIAKRFVELHGGTISITSEKHKGTTVSFTIPIYRTG
ncbi:MAG TPA: ATP-binding protein, partial [Spirochaetales bacterium]|nr:ATP-binding protein [Spirochaetales bacterium]